MANYIKDASHLVIADMSGSLSHGRPVLRADGSLWPLRLQPALRGRRSMCAGVRRQLFAKCWQAQDGEDSESYSATCS